MPKKTFDDLGVEKTFQGMRKCAAFLSEMLRIGWSKSELDDLEKLWWQYRDRNGNLKRT